MSDDIVSLRSVSRMFADGVLALRNVSLDIGRSELVAVVGPSGSGKSTMLNIIGTLDRASSGEVEIDGHNVASLSDSDLSALRAHRISFVFQHFHLSPGVSALDNVADGLLYIPASVCARAANGRRRPCCGWASITGWRTAPTSCRAESDSARRSPGHWRATRGCSSPTNRRVPWTALPAKALCSCCSGFIAKEPLWVVITHDRELAARFDRQVSVRDGALIEDTRPAS